MLFFLNGIAREIPVNLYSPNIPPSYPSTWTYYGLNSPVKSSNIPVISRLFAYLGPFRLYADAIDNIDHTKS